MILGIHHPSIAVPDMEAALAFYVGVLGFRVTMSAELPAGYRPLGQAMGLADPASSVRMLRKGNSCIELFEFAAPEPGDPARPVNRLGITHFALATDDCEADYAMLSANGVVFNAPLFGTSPNRFAYGRDPFGNVIELLEHLPGTASELDFRDP